MLGQIWKHHWIPGWILTNFHLNNIFLARKLAELEPGERCWCNTWTEPDLCGKTDVLICWGGILWNFKELGRKLKFRTKIGQKMSLKFNFKTAKDNYELQTSRAERGQTKCKIWLAGSNKFKFFLLNTGQKFKFLKNRVLQLKMGHKQQF